MSSLDIFKTTPPTRASSTIIATTASTQINNITNNSNYSIHVAAATAQIAINVAVIAIKDFENLLATTPCIFFYFTQIFSSV